VGSIEEEESMNKSTMESKMDKIELQKEIFVLAAFSVAKNINKESQPEFVNELAVKLKNFAEDYVNA
jgi:hypothetical protein